MHNKRRKINIAGYIITQAVIFILLILTFSLMWAKENYGSIGMSQIIFTLNMPLKGTSNSFLEGYIQDALIPVLCIFLVELLVTLPRKIKNYIVFNYNTEKKFPKNEMLKVQIYPLRLRWFVVVSISLIWMFALIQSADKAFGLIDFAKSQLASSELIENEYVDPGTAGLTFPEKKEI